MKKKALITLLLLFSVYLFGGGFTSIKINLKIVNEQGEAVPTARVHFYCNNFNLLTGADGEGKFFKKVKIQKGQTLKVNISKPGYESIRGKNYSFDIDGNSVIILKRIKKKVKK